MILYHKKANGSLTYGLSLKEFKCKCTYDSCTSTIINDFLLVAYSKFRKEVGIPLQINSGYRCPKHNLAVGGKPLSRHQVGEAVDISLHNLVNNFDKNTLMLLAKKSGFTFVKFYKTFMHLDVRGE